MQQNQLFAIAFVLIFFAVSVSLADEFTWDQTNDLQQPNIYRDISTFSPFGQEFTPNLDYVQVIQLVISNFLPDPAKITINIRSDSITGILLGTSNTITLPGNYTGIATFPFISVALQPRNLYVMEVVRTSGNAGVGGYSPATYQQGCAVLFGIPYDNIDIWFREGLFEGSALERLTWGSIKNAYL